TPIAVAGGTFAPDNSAPGATTISLSGTGPSVTLSWTSPGNDTYNGQQLGVAKEVDVRGSSSPITTANFDSATPLTGVPVPDLPGTSRSTTIDACSLNLRYFAIKTRDYAGNVSAMSNVVVAWPSQVADLSPNDVSKRCMTVTWTAPTSCTSSLASYDLR